MGTGNMSLRLAAAAALRRLSAAKAAAAANGGCVHVRRWQNTCSVLCAFTTSFPLQV